VSRVNAMCENFSARENQIGEPRTIADLVAKGPRVLDAFEETILEEARELDAPDEIAEQAERLVALAEQQRDVLADLIDAAENGQVAEARRLASRNQAFNEEANSITRELGAGACTAD
jgi:FixJ family two-component response regulator